MTTEEKKEDEINPVTGLAAAEQGRTERKKPMETFTCHICGAKTKIYWETVNEHIITEKGCEHYCGYSAQPSMYETGFDEEGMKWLSLRSKMPSRPHAGEFPKEHNSVYTIYKEIKKSARKENKL